MTEAPFDPDAVIDAMAPMLGLDPSRFDRTAIAENLRTVARLAALVLDPPIGDHAEPAAVFSPSPLPGQDGGA